MHAPRICAVLGDDPHPLSKTCSSITRALQVVLRLRKNARLATPKQGTALSCRCFHGIMAREQKGRSVIPCVAYLRMLLMSFSECQKCRCFSAMPGRTLI